MTDFYKGQKVRFTYNLTHTDRSRYDVGDIGIVTDVHGTSDGVSVFNLRTNYLCGHFMKDRFEPAPFEVGDRVKVINGDLSALSVGDKGIVNKVSPHYLSIDWDDGDHSNALCWSPNRFALVPPSEINYGESKMTRAEQTHHCMKVNKGGKSFKKLGDYKVSPDRIEEELFIHHGAGTYLVKIKNDTVGRIFKLEESQRFNMVEGF